jgi:hypothetical protein
MFLSKEEFYFFRVQYKQTIMIVKEGQPKGYNTFLVLTPWNRALIEKLIVA